jgi:hypothetical protein
MTTRVKLRVATSRMAEAAGGVCPLSTTVENNAAVRAQAPGLRPPGSFALVILVITRFCSGNLLANALIQLLARRPALSPVI